MRLRESRATFANVTAGVALVVAISGSAYAAATIKSADIVDNQVKSVDVRDDSLRGGGLTGNDIREDTLGTVPGADTLDGLDSNAFLRNNGKAADANLVDGLDSSAFLRTSGTAADAEMLDGNDHRAFVTGWDTKIMTNRFVMANGSGRSALLNIPGLGLFEAVCEEQAASIDYVNTTGGPVDFWQNGEGHFAGVARPDQRWWIVWDSASLNRTSRVVGLGTGVTHSNYRMATVHAFVLKEHDGWPCGFQIEVTLSVR